MRGSYVAIVFVGLSAVSASPQLPGFEDYRVAETSSAKSVAVKLTTASERLYRTRLTNAAKEPPNLAGHYRFDIWGCGSECAAGAVIDLQTGIVYAPPLGGKGEGSSHWIISPSMFPGSAIDFHLDSRLVVVRSGFNYSERLKANVPDVYYLLWEGDRFRQLLFISGKDAGH